MCINKSLLHYTKHIKYMWNQQLFLVTSCLKVLWELMNTVDSWLIWKIWQKKAFHLLYVLY